MTRSLVIDESFRRLLESLGRVSVRSLGNVANVILTWRKNRITASTSGSLKSAVNNAMDDKVVVGAELLCCETVISMLRFVTKENLGDMEWSTELEQACFSNIMQSRANNEEVRAKYIVVLGYLAPFRLQEITAKFKTVVSQFQAKPDAKNQAALEPVIAALSHLKLDISSVKNYSEVMALVTVFVDLIAGTKGFWWKEMQKKKGLKSLFFLNAHYFFLEKKKENMKICVPCLFKLLRRCLNRCLQSLVNFPWVSTMGNGFSLFRRRLLLCIQSWLI